MSLCHQTRPRTLLSTESRLNCVLPCVSVTVGEEIYKARKQVGLCRGAETASAATTGLFNLLVGYLRWRRRPYLAGWRVCSRYETALYHLSGWTCLGSVHESQGWKRETDCPQTNTAATTCDQKSAVNISTSGNPRSTVCPSRGTERWKKLTLEGKWIRGHRPGCCRRRRPSGGFHTWCQTRAPWRRKQRKTGGNLWLPGFPSSLRKHITVLNRQMMRLTWLGTTGRRQSWAAPEGIRWKQGAPLLAQTPGTRTPVTCTLEIKDPRSES